MKELKSTFQLLGGAIFLFGLGAAFAGYPAGLYMIIVALVIFFMEYTWRIILALGLLGLAMESVSRNAWSTLPWHLPLPPDWTLVQIPPIIMFHHEWLDAINFQLPTAAIFLVVEFVMSVGLLIYLLARALGILNSDREIIEPGFELPKVKAKKTVSKTVKKYKS